ncbi:wall-associated receptor kinase 2-like [Macadamia integrifolia]|uniref:wall-associated receptor kinase 2-like n=1 Tax=Macadamia integrifolia TaxID=60698 RepID=UPI001C4E3098|nr:wall-associated receptor kinase 2-like [Macadamia integrifolia]XP_042513796.1 wall-associated receptor kinase 2-like [Macadamia integrifolia]
MSTPLVLLPFLFIVQLWPAVATSMLPLTKPNCTSICGGVQVPYPFGLGADEECYRRVFKLICNDSYNPPKLIMGRNVEVINISFHGQLTVLSPVNFECYNKLGVRTDRNKISGKSGSRTQFTLSDTQNKFTALGCDTISNITGSNGRDFQSGCSMICSNKSDVINGSCAGIGCCQTSIPKGFANFNISLNSYENHTKVFDFNPCSYAFIVQDNWFNFSNSYLSKFTSIYKNGNMELVPLVYDWAIDLKSCEEAEKNQITYACKNKSECVTSKNGLGYSCICSNGYEGNPYLQDGCQDVNECKVATTHNCSENAKCKNRVGGYSCHCPLGFRGDGWRKGTSLYGALRRGSGCKDNIIPLIAGISACFIVLPVIIWFLYWAKKKRERMILFQENGGKLLEQRIKSSAHKGVKENFRFFTIKEVKKATKYFHDKNEIHIQGGFGRIFSGNLPNGKAISVKRYPLEKSEMKDQIIQFVNEVDVLSRIDHKHLVKLLGCCLDTDVPMLVYEYISDGKNLSEHIKEATISWEDRLRIAAEMADALDYLHSDSVPVFHGKFQSSNVLLFEENEDENSKTLVAKVSDFEASRLVPLYQTQRMTKREGSTKSVELEGTDKSDVYSFGVVLVELLTGEKQDLSAFVASLVQPNKEGKNLSHILDGRIANYAKEEQLQVVAEIVIGCLKDKSEDRPTMKEVAEKLRHFNPATSSTTA